MLNIVHWLVLFSLLSYLSVGFLGMYLLLKDRNSGKKILSNFLWCGFIGQTISIPFLLYFSNLNGAYNSTNLVVTNFLSNRGEYLFWISWGALPVFLFIRRSINSTLGLTIIGVVLSILLGSSSYVLHMDYLTNPASDLSLYSASSADTVVDKIFILFHVIPAIAAELFLIILLVLGIIYLTSEYRLRKKNPIKIALSLLNDSPSLQYLYKQIVRFLEYSFVSLTFSILIGVAWGAYSHIPFIRFDSTVLGAVLSWVILGTILYLRVYNFSTPKKIVITTVGFSMLSLTFFIVVAFMGTRLHKILFA